jgi:hypothetical protein
VEGNHRVGAREWELARERGVEVWWCWGGGPPFIGARGDPGRGSNGRLNGLNIIDGREEL